MKDIYLSELAEVIRSKNAGPYELTLDIIFKNEPIYQKFVSKRILTKESFCSLFRIPKEQVISIVEFAPARAVKVTLTRPTVSGDLGDTDIYGAQQHAPLLNWKINWK